MPLALYEDKTWKVVTGVPLDPPMAAAIAELMDGPRELIT